MSFTQFLKLSGTRQRENEKEQEHCGPLRLLGHHEIHPALFHAGGRPIQKSFVEGGFSSKIIPR